MSAYDQQLPPQDPYGYGGTYSGNSNMSRGLEPTVLKYRLDMESPLQKLELFLRSAKIQEREDTSGELITEMIRVARPLMNEDGVQAIMGYMTIVFGAHNVQGNIDRTQYDELIYEINVYLAKILGSNMMNWEVRDEDFDIIIECIMTTAQLFMSRPIDNKERDSYGQSMMTKEMNVVNAPDRKGILGRIFGRGS